MGTRVNYEGLVIAGIGFFLTRFTVALALYENPLRFYLAGVTPLVLGLGLAAFGVALAVADVDASLVRTTMIWCVVGGGAMLVLVVLTLLGSTAGSVPPFATIRSRTYLSNFLIGGSVGGTLTGLYAARNRRQREELQRQTRRLEVLNGMLRHEILNAVNVIQGYATMDPGENPEASGIIREHSTAIQQTVEEVKHLTRSARTETAADATVDLATHLAASVETVSERYPDTRISVGAYPDDLSVRATDRLERLFTHLLVNAVVRGRGSAPSVTVTATADSVRVSVSSGAVSAEQGDGALDADDPGAEFRLNMVRLLAESYGGTMETDPETGAATVVLPRADPRGTGVTPNRAGLAGVRPAFPHLLVTLGSAVIAGVFYGIVSDCSAARSPASASSTGPRARSWDGSPTSSTASSSGSSSPDWSR